MRTIALASILFAAMLAGCTDNADTGDNVPDDGVPMGDEPMLHGWIFDEALVPLPGASVEILEVGTMVTADGNGYYEFLEVLPVNEPLIVVARQDEFKPASHQLTLQAGAAVRLNLSLEPEPVLQPNTDELNFDGFLNCQYNVELSGTQYFNDCSGGSGGDIWQFSVGPNLAGLVIEIGWQSNSDLSQFLMATLESQNLSDQTIVLSQNVGPSVLRLQVAEQFARKYYPEGGIMQLTVNVDPNNGAQETEAGASVAVSQPFQVCATAFYVEPPEQGYQRCG